MRIVLFLLVLGLIASVAVAENTAGAHADPKQKVEESELLPLRQVRSQKAKLATKIKVASLVKRAFVAPLRRQESDRSRFSRASTPPEKRRVRVTQTGVTGIDGRTFARFAVDAEYPVVFENEAKWQEQFVGCAYLDAGRVYLDIAGRMRSAERIVGQKGHKVPSGACKAASKNTPKIAQR